MKLIVGLGNPGKKYEKTRHNVGFMVIDELSRKWNVSINKEKFKGLIGECLINNDKVILLKPQTYMNLSGESIREVCDFYKISIDDILVIYDDLDLPTGKIRVKPTGGSGGHNGLKSIESHLGTKNYKRIRIGIDKDKFIPTADYVLGLFSKEQRDDINEAVVIATTICDEFITNDFNKIMSKYN